jgi:hypothetical protein
MHSLNMLAVAAAALFLAGLASSPSYAQSPTAHPGYAPGQPVNPYINRRGPDGTYDSLADFISDIRGRPCGIQCTQEAWARWAAYYHRPNPYNPYGNQPLQPRY